MQLKFTRSFEKEFALVTRGNPTLKKKVSKKLEILLSNPKHPSLRLHKLTKDEFWSISIDESIRVLVYFHNDKIYIYHIGKHEEVYK